MTYKERLDYREGRLYWKDGTRAGKEAGTLDPTTGYKVFRFEGKKVACHRVVWEILEGETPYMIDHINHDKTDNRRENLRDCTQHLNQHNRKGLRDRDNTSGGGGFLSIEVSRSGRLTLQGLTEST